MRAVPAAAARPLAARALGLLLLLLGPLLPAAAAGDAFETARRLGRGINILGYDGLWDGGTDAPFRARDFRTIREAGFSHVRINLHAFQHMDASGRLDPETLRHLDWAVERSLAAGLVPIVDEHDFSSCQSDPAACGAKLRSFWREVSVHYAGRAPQLVFELLNEPGGALTAEGWNALLADLLVIVRAGNPDRTVIVAAINSDDPTEIRRLRLPESDRNLIVTVHYYRPFRFTHQGAPWAPEVAGLRGVAWGGAAEEAELRSDLAGIAAWARAAGRPVYLGEFGAYEAAGLAARARWSGFVAREAEAQGWPWAAWQFDHDFAVFDRGRDAWIRPLLDALVPPAKRRSGPGASRP